MSDYRADTEAIPVVAEDPDADPGRQLAWMVIGQGLALLSVAVWVTILVIASPAGGGGPGSWLFTATVWAFPLWPIGFSTAAWVYRSRGRSSWAGVLMTVAFAPAALMLLLYGLSAL